MGKVETLGLVVAMAGALGTQRAEAPPEAVQISTTKELIQMSREDFASWCDDKASTAEAAFDSDDPTLAACSWVDADTSEVWHSVLHFRAGESFPHQADAGLLHASGDTVRRLVHKEHGAADGRSREGLPVWEIEVDGRAAFLAVAEFDEITLVRLRLVESGVPLSTR